MTKMLIRSAISYPGALGLISFFQENGFEVVGTDIVADSFAKPIVNRYYQVPKAEQSKEAVEKYQNIVNETSASWIISGPENEVTLLAEYRDRFKPCQIFHPDKTTLDLISNKLACYDQLSAQVSIPLSIPLDKFKKWPKDQTGVVLKPIQGRGSAGVYLTTVDLLEHWSVILHAKDYLIQERIIGTEYSVDTLHDMNSRLLNCVVRIRQVVNSGMSIVSKTVKHPKLFELIQSLSETIRFKGVGCIQFIETEDGDLFLTDINPRFGGGAIVSIKASQSFQKNLLSLLNQSTTIKPLPPFEYEECKMFRAYKERYEF